MQVAHESHQDGSQDSNYHWLQSHVMENIEQAKEIVILCD
jgi:hypothetical protein